MYSIKNLYSVRNVLRSNEDYLLAFSQTDPLDIRPPNDRISYRKNSLKEAHKASTGLLGVWIAERTYCARIRYNI